MYVKVGQSLHLCFLAVLQELKIKTMHTRNKHAMHTLIPLIVVFLQTYQNLFNSQNIFEKTCFFDKHRFMGCSQLMNIEFLIL